MGSGDGKNAPTAADRMSRALIQAGDKAGGILGFKLANAVSIVLLNRDWKPCDDACGCTDAAAPAGGKA